MNKTCLQHLLLASSLAFATLAHAVIIDFDVASDYDSNFVERNNISHVSWNNSGYLEKTQDGSSTLYLNQGATGGASGSGGTTFDVDARDTFGGTLASGNAFRISADIRSNTVDATSASNATSVGFYLKVPNGEGSGYALVFRFNNNADVRLFGPNATPNTAGVGTQIGATQNFGGNLTANTWYTAVVDVVDVAGGVEFSASLFEQGGDSIGSTLEFSHSSSPILGAQQVGLRLGTGPSRVINVDNFSIVAIPEPGTLALVGLALGSLAFLRRRR
jgi:hypothetical protein